MEEFETVRQRFPVLSSRSNLFGRVENCDLAQAEPGSCPGIQLFGARIARITNISTFE